jgi:REP element-mobilizing transposase RayT
MKRTKSLQAFLPGFDGLKTKEFGGTHTESGKRAKGNPREQRPIAQKRPLHLVLRSTLARGSQSFLIPTRARQIERIARELGREKQVRLYHLANAGNHLHLVLQPKSRKAFNSYIRALTGVIARITLGVERGKSKGLQFWDARPYTRIIEWGKDYRGVINYLIQNTLEALGFIPYKPRARAGPSKP